MSSGRLRISVLLLTTLALSPPARADEAVPGDLPQLFANVEEYRLDNGLLFLLLPRPAAPQVSARLLVKAGNADSPDGASGLAHMFEHMAFKGTTAMGTDDAAAEAALLDSVAVLGETLRRAVTATPPADSAAVAAAREAVVAAEARADALADPMDFFHLMERFTTMYNASTGKDYTIYDASFPPSGLEAWALLESERQQDPVYRQFYAELEVVKEERRQRTDDNPEGAAWEKMQALAYGEHPYADPTVGYMAELETLTPGQAADFHARHYVPGNMVGALVGNFDPADARRLIKAYFGDIPAGPLPPPLPPPTIATDGPRRAVHRQGEERQLIMAFSGVEPGSPERALADVLAELLARDRTSALVKRLDLEAGVARNVYAYPDGGCKRERGLFVIEVDVMPEHDNQEAEALVWEELRRLQEQPVSAETLAALARVMRKDFIFGLQRSEDIAELLVKSEAGTGDWRNAYGRVADYAEATPASIRALARTLFTPERATVVHLEPADDDAKGGRP